ncbi:MAG: hypothetical protein IRZ07_00625 [Microbispora sp.]|nr:hypothetical protein [Microbispora sp.]
MNEQLPSDSLSIEHERRITRCRTCQARIVWLKTAAGKNMPVDADSVEPGDETFEYGRHVSHFSTCKQADQHRRRKVSDEIGRRCDERAIESAATMSESKHTIYESRASTHADDCWSWGAGHYKCAVRKIERLRTENARLREDAARYRLLRKGAVEDVAVVRGLGAMDYGMSAVVCTYSDELDGDDLDAAIDQARGKGVQS